MYAIIQSGSKQYKVKEGSIIDVELLKGDETTVSFSEVLYFSDDKTPLIGTPFVPGCLVTAEKVTEVKGPKVIAFKYKRRKSTRVKKGHRQRYTRLRITNIQQGA